MAEGTPRSVLKQVNGWKLGNTLGKGGFGHVRVAHHATGRQAAVKILPALDFTQPISRDALLDAIEAEKEVVLLKMCAGFKMKGVVGINMVKEEEGWKYLFLPLAPKVASHMRTPVSADKFIPFFRSLLCSLQVLHSVGCTHEDLKPANVLINDDGEPVLADFGFATFEPRCGRRAGGGGTLDYLSPEKVEVSIDSTCSCVVEEADRRVSLNLNRATHTTVHLPTSTPVVFSSPNGTTSITRS